MLLSLFWSRFHCYLYNNLIIIACIIGSINCIFQINFCQHSYKYAKELQAKINNENKKLIILNDVDYNSEKFIYHNTYGTDLRSLILSPTKTVEKLIVDEYLYPNSTFNENTFIQRGEDYTNIVINGTYIPYPFRYLDLKNIVNLIDEKGE